jgi:hypothetical protein
MSPFLSDQFVHCPADPVGYDPGDKALTLTFSAQPGDRLGPERVLMSQRIYAVAARPTHVQSNVRPAPLISISNEFDIRLFCEMQTDGTQPPREFLLRSRIKLPLGWEAFEIYPPYDSDTWNPSVAPLWAENTLLATVIQRNLSTNQLRELDPHVQARKEAAHALHGLEQLLGGDEEPLHQYLKANPKLLMRTLVNCWSKLALGSRVTDFVLRDAAGDYLLIELEKPSHRLFGKSGKPSAELQHAIDQIVDWKRYLEDNISTVRRELGLKDISTNPRAVVVIGRRSTLSDENRRKLLAIENAQPKLKIMTYDDVLAGARTTFENILGPIWDPGPNTELYYLPSKTPSIASTHRANN